MALVAGDIQLPTDLSQALGSNYSIPANMLTSNYSNIRNRAAGNNPNAQPGVGSYAAERLPVAQSLGEQGLSNTLYSTLGNAAYQNQLAQRQYNQNMELTKATAGAMAPTILQQIEGGVGAGANSAAKGLALYQSLGGGTTPSGGTPATTSLYGTGSTAMPPAPEDEMSYYEGAAYDPFPMQYPDEELAQGGGY